MSVNPLNYALHQVVEQQDIGAVRLLVNQKASVNSFDPNGCTPLLLAIEDEDSEPEMVKALIDLKAHVNLVYNFRNGKTTALHDAAYFGVPEIVKIILEAKADVSQRDGNGTSPLHIATSYGFEEVIKLLLKHGAHPDVCNHEARTPLHLVVLESRYAVNTDEEIESLIGTLVNGNADINALDRNSDTPLAILAKRVEEVGADWCDSAWPSVTCLSFLSHGAEVPPSLEGHVLKLLSPLPISQLRLFMVELNNQKRQKLDS